MLKRVAVFCGSWNGTKAEYIQTAHNMGVSLAERGLELVYGGGRVGMMGAVADAALGAGGRVIGVIPQALFDKEIAHQGVTDLRVVKSMHERKALMAELSDAFITLPGGFGTLEEFFEILTWAQLGFHRKALAILNVGGFFDPLLALVDHMIEEGFIAETHRSLIVIGEQPHALLDVLQSYRPPLVDKWLKRDDL